MKTSRITCLAIATLLTFGSFARAHSPRHLDELAVTAERQSRQVLYQTYRLHAYGPAAQTLKNNAFQMIRLAKHVHDVAHVDPHAFHGRHPRPGDRIERQAHLNRDVAELDRVMHEMENLVIRMKSVTRRPSYDHHPPGHIGISLGRKFALSINTGGASYGQHGHGFRAPTALDRIEASLAELSVTVHHLLDDTDVACCRKR